MKINSTKENKRKTLLLIKRMEPTNAHASHRSERALMVAMERINAHVCGRYQSFRYWEESNSRTQSSIKIDAKS